jgi:pimeloyl-ACP methyl ester carboxylesterase
MHVPRDEAASAIGRRRFLAETGRLALLVALGSMAGGGFRQASDVDGSGNAAPARAAKTRLIALPRSSLSFSRQGSGPPLLLLHGAGCSRRAWSTVTRRLAQRYDVLTPDLPGFGQSPALIGAAPDVPALADAVASWLKKIGVERPHIVGNSLGGGIAIELWMRRAAQSVTVLSPVGFWSSAEYIYAQQAIKHAYSVANQLRPLLPLIIKSTAASVITGLFYARASQLETEYLVDAIEDMLDSAPTLFEAVDATRRYQVGRYQTDVPLTVAWGAEDRLLIGPQHQRARNRIFGARHLLLPGCGHVCMADDPALVIRTINETVIRSTALG